MYSFPTVCEKNTF